MEIRTVKLADFSPQPFGRYPTDGPYSGQRFRREVLRPLFADSTIGKICVDFNGILPVGSSFLDEAFAGLVRNEGITVERVRDTLEIVSEFPFYRMQIEDYLREVEGV